MSSSDITNEGNGITTGTVQEVFDMNPANAVVWDTDAETADVIIEIDCGAAVSFNHICILNHNLHTANALIDVYGSSTVAGGGVQNQAAFSAILNGESVAANADPPADGDTIMVIACGTGSYRYWRIIISDDSTFAADVSIGCILLGKIHTLSHRANVGIPRRIGYGNSVRTSQGGKSYSNLSWDKASYSPFRGSAAYRQGGKLAYDMKYSYINDTQLIRSDLSAVTDDGNFLHDVKNKTFGDHIPLIFVGDSTSTTAGDYLFCRMTQSEITESQVPNVMDLTVQLIEEF